MPQMKSNVELYNDLKNKYEYKNNECIGFSSNGDCLTIILGKQEYFKDRCSRDGRLLFGESEIGYLAAGAVAPSVVSQDDAVVLVLEHRYLEKEEGLNVNFEQQCMMDEVEYAFKNNTTEQLNKMKEVIKDNPDMVDVMMRIEAVQHPRVKLIADFTCDTIDFWCNECEGDDHDDHEMTDLNKFKFTNVVDPNDECGDLPDFEDEICMVSNKIALDSTKHRLNVGGELYYWFADYEQSRMYFYETRKDMEADCKPA